jgi:hypothetical protein
MSEQDQEVWRLYFESNGYLPLIKKYTEGIRHLKIEEFCDDDGMIPEELSEIYLLCNRSGIPCELLIILDIRKEFKEDEQIKALCRRWDEYILSFLNFGNLPGFENKTKYLLKYNVMQILLSDEVSSNCSIALTEEKSTDISRKLFVTVKNGNIVESDLSMLPFYFDQLIQDDTAPESENELSNILPGCDKLTWLYEVTTTEKEFSEDNIMLLKEWLINADD